MDSEEWFFLPGLWVKSHEGVALHFDPAHLLTDIGPSFLLEKGSGTKLCSVIWHVVEHIEEYVCWEVFDRCFRQIFRFTHVVAGGNAEILLIAVAVVL